MRMRWSKVVIGPIISFCHAVQNPGLCYTSVGMLCNGEETILPGPTATFGFILATLYGAGFHFVVGGDVRRLALFLLSAWVGFGLGQLLA